MLAQEQLDFGEIGRVIRAKKQRRPRPGVLRDIVKKPRLQQTVFMVSLFRPRVGEKHINSREPGIGWQHFQKEAGLGPHEMQAVESSPVAFLGGAAYAMEVDIDANTIFCGMGFGVSRQEVPMAAANLPDEMSPRRQQMSDFRAQGFSSLSHTCEIRRIGRVAILPGVAPFFDRPRAQW